MLLTFLEICLRRTLFKQRLNKLKQQEVRRQLIVRYLKRTCFFLLVHTNITDEVTGDVTVKTKFETRYVAGANFLGKNR